MARRPASSPGASPGDVFRLIRDGQAATRTEIGRLTGLSRTAVTLRVGQLVELGLVVERGEGESSGGRPAGRLEFNAAGGVVLAAALGASRAQLAVCDLAGGVLAEDGLHIDLADGPDVVLSRAAKQLEKLLAGAEVPDGSLRGVGVSVPGAVDIGTGRSVSPPVQPGWGDVAVAEFFAGPFGTVVRVENDVNALALAEHRSRAGIDDMLVIKASTGIGAAIIAGGTLQRGAFGAAGELGHVKVADGGGAVCRCGSVDCLEAVASGWVMARELAALGKPVDDALGIAELARAGDPDALRLVRHAGRQIGEVASGAVNLLNPAMIVIGGDLARADEPLVAGIRELVYQRSTAAATRNLRIEPAAVGERTGVSACTTMILDEVLSASAVDRMIIGR